MLYSEHRSVGEVPFLSSEESRQTYRDFRPSPQCRHGVEAVVKVWDGGWLRGQETRPPAKAEGRQAPLLFLQRRAYSWVRCHLLYCLVAESLLVQQGRGSEEGLQDRGLRGVASAWGEGRVCDGTACA